MSELPANWRPPPAPEGPKAHRKALWKPLLVTLVTSGVLAIITCAGGLSLVAKHGDLGVFLIGVALLLGLVFMGSLVGAVVYFFVWLIEGARESK